MSAPGPCASCRKACCANYTVSVTGYDAWVIAKGLHLPPDSFLVYFPAAEKNERGFLLEPKGTRYEIALDKVGPYRKGNPCVFWVDLGNGGGGRCGIYPYRPMVCQTYPAYQDQDTVALRNDVLCPEGAWSLTGMDLPVFRQRLYRFRMEQDVYTYLTWAWNDSVERAGRTFSVVDFYTALMNVYEGVNRWTTRVPPDAMNEIVKRWGAMPPAAPNPLFADLAATGDHVWRSAISDLREQIRQSAPWFVEARELVAAAV
jgi:Fe-S-cluster containining protein